MARLPDKDQETLGLFVSREFMLDAFGDRLGECFYQQAGQFSDAIPEKKVVVRMFSKFVRPLASSSPRLGSNKPK